MTIQILKDCPFCGGKATLSEYDPYDGYQGDCTRYVVRCTHCGIKIEDRKQNKAIYSWNTRVQI